MGQSFKNVYFRDCPKAASGRSSLTIAFGSNDDDVFKAVRHLSSDTLRNALGYQSFVTLQQHAQGQGKSLNAFCLSILRRQVDATMGSGTAELPGFKATNPIVLDPIQATFNGGRHEPLHDWYPYLEGYSPAFVESVIGNYCAGARKIFDPFAGTGTTPLTASRLGRQAYFSEINPILQFLISSKVLALKLADHHRDVLSAGLKELADGLVEHLDKSRPDATLRRSYRATFGESQFFDAEVFEDILRYRTLIDQIGCTEPLAARYLTIAVLRSLIPASRLIRRGDVRFKTDSELARGRIDLREATCAALNMIARDIQSLYQIKRLPTLILENAKHLDRIPELSIDAVISSPPYLNGTNYFRNTKVELWFLGCLKSRNDLARYRFESMTVGINDVTVGKPIGELPTSVTPVLKTLEEKAYDARIPRMVACFASEMHALLQALGGHMRGERTIVIDIGDSAYAGVHVPTDKFIIESLDAAGYDVSDEIVLRQRYSRSRFRLSQKLLVFRPKSRQRSIGGRAEKTRKKWGSKWERFKRTLPHQQNEFAKRNWGHPLHSLCSYQGKMKPALAAHLIRTFASRGERMLDPFSGVGTIPFEAALHGVESWGFDISPPAVHITAGKIEKWTTQETEETIKTLQDFLNNQETTADDFESAKSIRFNKALTSYFHERTLNEILLARRFFLDNPPANASQSLVFACLLHILHGNRPYALSRRSHPITPFAPSGATDYRELIPRLRAKLERSLSTSRPKGFTCGHSIFHDATKWWPAHVENLDAVITSPPFFASTRFHLGNWMRLWFSGWEKVDFQHRPLSFVDERQKQGFDVYHPVLRQARERLKPGGVVVFHLGASKKCDMGEELARVARKWFRVTDTYIESVSHCESHGIRDKGAVVSHQYLVLQ